MDKAQTETSTHFGAQQVPTEEKASRVAEVFNSVAPAYDLMNDLMSAGLHRLWKAFTLSQSAVRKGARVLDIAGGTGDLSLGFAERVGETGEVWLTDINNRMLTLGRDRLCDLGHLLPTAQCDAEKLPFPDNYFDCVSVAFGLRNMTHKDRALSEMRRVLKPGGRLLVLEFSKIWSPLAPLYQFYSFNILPRLGRWLAKDEASYRYLAESIRVHPDQESIKNMMLASGLERVEYFNLSLGICALHRGFKF